LLRGSELRDCAVGGIGEKLDSALAQCGRPAQPFIMVRITSVSTMPAGVFEYSRDRRIRLRSNTLRVGRGQCAESTYEPPFAGVGWS